MKANKEMYISRMLGMVLLPFLTLLIATHSYAQKAVARIDTTSIKIGEQVQLHLDVTLPSKATIKWPVFSDTAFSSIEIVNRSKVDTLETTRNTYVQLRQTLTITSFDTGYHTIPQISIQYRVPGDTTHVETLTDSLLLHVRTVDVDTTRAIRDIKAQMQAPLTLAELWPIFGGAALLGLIAGFIWYYLWRRKMNKPLFPVIRRPQLPPWQIALDSLDELETKKLWQAGKVKEYYTEITDVVRTYIEGQHQVPAMEMISSDIIDSLEQKGIENTILKKVERVLVLADLVKFAKENPLPPENAECLSNARTFILETKPGEVISQAETEEQTSTSNSI